jgi:hypothetical protein
MLLSHDIYPGSTFTLSAIRLVSVGVFITAGASGLNEFSEIADVFNNRYFDDVEISGGKVCENLQWRLIETAYISFKMQND